MRGAADARIRAIQARVDANEEFLRLVRGLIEAHPLSLGMVCSVPDPKHEVLGAFAAPCRQPGDEPPAPNWGGVLRGCVANIRFAPGYDARAAVKAADWQLKLKRSFTAKLVQYLSGVKGNSAPFVVCAVKMTGTANLVLMPMVDFKRVLQALKKAGPLAIDYETPAAVCEAVTKEAKRTGDQYLQVCRIIPSGVPFSGFDKTYSDHFVQAIRMEVTGLLPADVVGRPPRADAGRPAQQAAAAPSRPAKAQPPAPGVPAPARGFNAAFIQLCFEQHIRRPASTTPREAYAHSVEFIRGAKGLRKNDAKTMVHLMVADRRAEELRSGKPLSEFEDLTGFFATTLALLTQTAQESVSRTRTARVLAAAGWGGHPAFAWAFKDPARVDGLIGGYAGFLREGAQPHACESVLCTPEDVAFDWDAMVGAPCRSQPIGDDVTDDECLAILQVIESHHVGGGTLDDVHPFLSVVTDCRFRYVKTPLEFQCVRRVFAERDELAIREIIRESARPAPRLWCCPAVLAGVGRAPAAPSEPPQPPPPPPAHRPAPAADKRQQKEERAQMERRMAELGLSLSGRQKRRPARFNAGGAAGAWTERGAAGEEEEKAETSSSSDDADSDADA